MKALVSEAAKVFGGLGSRDLGTWGGTYTPGGSKSRTFKEYPLLHATTYFSQIQEKLLLFLLDKETQKV